MTFRSIKSIASILVVVLSTALVVVAEPHVTTVSRTMAPARSATFTVPARLRPRVNFWIDIFTRYGKDQVVIHHREYPQAIFGVLDFSSEGEGLSPVQMERLRKQRIEKTISRVREAIKHLAGGGEAQGEFEEQVLDAMRFVPGQNRFQRTLADNDSIRSQTGIREKYAEAMRRSGQYIDIMESIFTREYNLPKELTRLPFIESSFDYRAYSSVGAAGIWQFMRRTGMLYLTINKVIDERRDPIASTRAAARYLMHAYEELGTWPLAITSYNHGITGVARKARDYGTSDLVNLIENPFGERPFGFASSNFYPEFLAALDVYDSPNRYFPEVSLDAPIHTKPFELPRAMTVAQLTKELGLEQDSIRAVNLALTESTWNNRYPIPKGYKINVPSLMHVRTEKIEKAELAPIETPRPSAAYSAAMYRVKKGDSLAGIAKRYHISVDELRAANQLEGDNIRIGQQLNIKRVESEEIRKEREIELYTVKSGDTLHDLAKQFGISVSMIRAQNNLSSTKLSIGQKLSIPKRKHG